MGSVGKRFSRLYIAGVGRWRTLLDAIQRDAPVNGVRKRENERNDIWEYYEERKDIWKQCGEEI